MQPLGYDAKLYVTSISYFPIIPIKTKQARAIYQAEWNWIWIHATIVWVAMSTTIVIFRGTDMGSMGTIFTLANISAHYQGRISYIQQWLEALP